MCIIIRSVVAYTKAPPYNYVVIELQYEDNEHHDDDDDDEEEEVKQLWLFSFRAFFSSFLFFWSLLTKRCTHL